MAQITSHSPTFIHESMCTAPPPPPILLLDSLRQRRHPPPPPRPFHSHNELDTPHPPRPFHSHNEFNTCASIELNLCIIQFLIAVEHSVQLTFLLPDVRYIGSSSFCIFHFFFLENSPKRVHWSDFLAFPKYKSSERRPI